MKIYETAEIIIISVDAEDVIVTSPLAEEDLNWPGAEQAE